MIELKELKKEASNLTILYAEDEEDVRVNMISMLQLFFDNVFVAKDGKEAIEIFKSNEVDIVLTDIRMPYKTGLEVASYVKNVNKNIPIIIATAHSDTEYLSSAIKIGVNNYLLKPVNQLNLIESISEVVSNIVNRKKSLKYDSLIKEENDISEKKSLLTDIVNIYNIPTLVVENNRVYFMNNEFLKEFQFYEEIMEDINLIEKFITKKENYAKSLTDLGKYREKIILNNKEYLAHKKNLFIGIDVEIFTFEK